MVKSGGPSKAYHYIIGQLKLETEITGKTICDLGCGPGELAYGLSKLGGIVTGIDSSSSALLSFAKTLTAQVCWIQDDALRLQSVQDHSFDIVISCLMLMDVTDH